MFVITFWVLLTAVSVFALLAGFHYGFHRGYLDGVARANQAQIDGVRIGSDEAIRRGNSEVEMYRERCKIENTTIAERSANETAELRKRQEDSVAYHERLNALAKPATSAVN